MVSYPLNTPDQAQPLPIGGGLFFALFRANVAAFVSRSTIFPSPAAEPPRAAKQAKKKRDGLLPLRSEIRPLRSEIRWALFVVLYQVSAHLYAVVGVPEPQDQLTI